MYAILVYNMSSTSTHICTDYKYGLNKYNNFDEEVNYSARVVK